MRFLYEEPAICHKGALIIGDTHFGIEDKMARKGIRQNDISVMLADKIKFLIKKTNSNKLIILGDVKDNILSVDETTRKILSGLSDVVEVIVVKGNHDGGIEAAPNIKVIPPAGFVYEGLGLIHGHAFPSEELMQCDYLISAHQHIQFDFHDRNKTHVRKIWAVLNANKEAISKRYGIFNEKIKLILMPSFNVLVGKSLKHPGDEHLGPLFENKLFKWEHAILYGMDGVCFGELKNINELITNGTK
ncbi:MAG: metallophosphoesterase [Candidatus Micrarchaeota archaeon]